MAHAAQMLGWPADVIIGRNMHALVHHTHADGRHDPEADCPIFKAFRQGLPCGIGDGLFWRADGSAFDVEYTSHPIEEHGVVQGAVVTLVDIPQRREAQTLLRCTNRRWTAGHRVRRHAAGRIAPRAAPVRWHAPGRRAR